MTNPNPTETAPRWIPAAEKPGGLVFGDIVRSPKWFRTNPDLVVLRINPHGTACVQCEQGTNYCGGIELADLLVRIAELEGDVSERVSFESAVGQLLDEVKRRYEVDVAQAAKAERAKCGERIEEMAGTLKTTAERLHSKGKFADAARYMDYSGAMLSFGKHAIAADHIEANGRDGA